MNTRQSTSDPFVACVILNYNALAFLPDCIRTLKVQNHASIRIIVSDNGSTDGSIEWLRSEHPDAELIENGKNLGWSAGNNVGIRRALASGADWVWILNCDIEMEPDCVSRLLQFARANPQCGILAPLMHYFEPREEVWSYGGRFDVNTFHLWHSETLEEFKSLPQLNRYVSGCAMLVRRDVFEQIGLFDERLFMYCEDADFCVRATRSGYDVDVVQDAILYHKAHFGGSGSGQPRGSPFIRYHNVRSGLVFWRKHVGWWRYHREYCRRFLGKWLLPISELYADAGTRLLAEATIDGVWGAMIPQCQARPRIESPRWFRRLMVQHPWVVAELLAFRWPFERK